MSKQKTKNKQAKPLFPTLKGFMIPILYCLLVSAINTVVLLIYTAQGFGAYITHFLSLSIVREKNAFEAFFRNFGFFLSESFANAIISMMHDALPIAMITSLLALVIVLIVIRIKKGNLTSLLPAQQNSKKANLCAIMIGLGISGLMVGFDALSDTLITAPILKLVRDISGPFHDYITQDFDILVEGKWLPDPVRTVAGYLLRAFLCGALDYTRYLSISIINVMLHAVICALIFGLGTTGNFKKKMPAALAVIFSTLLYAVLGSAENSFLFALITGLFISLIYLKTESLLSTALFSLSTGFFGIVGMAGKLLFGNYYVFSINAIENRHYMWDFTSYPLHPFSPYDCTSPETEQLYSICSTVFLILAAVVAIPLLIVGIVMLVKLRENGNDSKQEIAQEPVHDLEDDPFANT